MSVPVNAYRGKSQRQKQASLERIRLARAIELYINSQSPGNSEVAVITYAQMVNVVGGSIQVIAELLAPVGGGSTGIRVYRPERSEASSGG